MDEVNEENAIGNRCGGTFTDFVLVQFDPEVSASVHKTLSTPAAPEQAILKGITAMGLKPYLDDGSLQIVHGSTVATNAVLEGSLARTMLSTTALPTCCS